MRKIAAAVGLGLLVGLCAASGVAQADPISPAPGHVDRTWNGTPWVPRTYTGTPYNPDCR
jgi:hypothetical protein